MEGDYSIQILLSYNYPFYNIGMLKTLNVENTKIYFFNTKYKDFGNLKTNLNRYIKLGSRITEKTPI